jgi:hypothetical protein
MKKIAFSLGFLFIFFGFAQAQTNWDGTGFRFGIHASPTWSWMSSSDKLLEGTSSNWGLKLGMSGEKYFSRNYAIASGIGFGFNAGGTIQNGYAYSNPWPNSDLTIALSETDTTSLAQNAKLHYRLTYVEIPFALRMRGGSGESSRLNFFAEAPVFTLGFLTKALGDIRGDSNNFNTDDEDIREDVNGLSLSWGLGAGIEYELAEHATVVGGLYYQHQFTDMTSDKGRVYDSLRGEWKNEDAKTIFRAITLRIGFYF